jgi:hypothetical protein
MSKSLPCVMSFLLFQICESMYLGAPKITLNMEALLIVSSRTFDLLLRPFSSVQEEHYGDFTARKSVLAPYANVNAARVE